MRIIAISDTHMCHRSLKLPDGDVLIHAGDSTSTGTTNEVLDFCSWLRSLPYKHKIMIAGNHDMLFERNPAIARGFTKDIIYLEDSHTKIDGKKIYGSPWQPEFMGWAFGLKRQSVHADEVWKKIPGDLDVLITHGPPYGVLDRKLGCQVLADYVKRLKPKHHIFGHIHEPHGWVEENGTRFYNVAIMNEHYDAVFEPTVIDL